MPSPWSPCARSAPPTVSLAWARRPSRRPPRCGGEPLARARADDDGIRGLARHGRCMPLENAEPCAPAASPTACNRQWQFLVAGACGDMPAASRSLVPRLPLESPTIALPPVEWLPSLESASLPCPVAILASDLGGLRAPRAPRPTPRRPAGGATLTSAAAGAPAQAGPRAGSRRKVICAPAQPKAVLQAGPGLLLVAEQREGRLGHVAEAGLTEPGGEGRELHKATGWQRRPPTSGAQAASGPASSSTTASTAQHISIFGTTTRTTQAVTVLQATRRGCRSSGHAARARAKPFADAGGTSPLSMDQRAAAPPRPAHQGLVPDTTRIGPQPVQVNLQPASVQTTSAPVII